MHQHLDPTTPATSTTTNLPSEVTKADCLELPNY